jgi:tRNA-specific 2-thiouridylase
MAKVLCAMSGGVDSSVAALLLKRAGHDVLGVFLRLGPDAAAAAGGLARGSHRACCSVEDSRDASLVASRLGIPYYSLNYEGEFRRIIDEFVEEYHRGRTPNPCARCNQWLKFGSLRGAARALGCDAVATGHYARIERDGAGRARLLRGRDAAKDQSYFLFLMPRESLAATMFPVGGLAKGEVRALARDAGLPVSEKPESQEICFVPNDDYREVLRARSPERLRPGRFLDLSGRILGEHAGHQNFTIGQRRGIGIALGKPHYVVGIDAAAGTVTLGEREALRRTEADVSGVEWTSIDAPAAGREVRVEAQIRHRHRARPATVSVTGAGTAVLRFDEPEEAVTPGQAAVFYDGEVLLGGGWIDAAR